MIFPLQNPRFLLLKYSHDIHPVSRSKSPLVPSPSSASSLSHDVAAASVLHHQRRHLGIAIATGAAGGLQDALSMLSPCCCDVAQ